jgi:hypothetical protein
LKWVSEPLGGNKQGDVRSRGVYAREAWEG